MQKSILLVISWVIKYSTIIIKNESLENLGKVVMMEPPNEVTYLTSLFADSS
jgi:hypothetical protein